LSVEVSPSGLFVPLLPFGMARMDVSVMLSSWGSAGGGGRSLWEALLLCLVVESLSQPRACQHQHGRPNEAGIVVSNRSNRLQDQRAVARAASPSASVAARLFAASPSAARYTFLYTHTQPLPLTAYTHTRPLLPCAFSVVMSLISPHTLSHTRCYYNSLTHSHAVTIIVSARHSNSNGDGKSKSKSISLHTLTPRCHCNCPHTAHTLSRSLIKRSPPPPCHPHEGPHSVLQPPADLPPTFS